MGKILLFQRKDTGDPKTTLIRSTLAQIRKHVKVGRKIVMALLIYLDAVEMATKTTNATNVRMVMHDLD
jgi:hypothetical protein